MLFDSSDEETEEVSLGAPEEDSGDSDDTELRNEVETRLGSETSSTNTSTSSSSSSTSLSNEVSLKDIKKQNERIISLLEDIKNGKSSENNDDSSVAGGDPTELL